MSICVLCCIPRWQSLSWTLGNSVIPDSKQLVHHGNAYRHSFQPMSSSTIVLQNQRFTRNLRNAPILHRAANIEVTEAASGTTSLPRNTWRFFIAVVKTGVLWGSMWLWFVESFQILEFLATKDVRLEQLACAILGCLPIALAQKRLVSFCVPKVASKQTNLPFWSHIFQSARGPYIRAIQAILLYFAVNTLDQSVAPDFNFMLPDHLKFIDPNRDGILSALELTMVVTQYSNRLLSAILATCVGKFFLSAKQPPAGWRCQETGLIPMYWNKVSKKDGLFTLIDLGFTLLAVWLVALRWFRFFGLDAQTVLACGGIGGLAFGLAAQDLVGNVISWLLILLSRPFKVGDHIHTKAAKGYIEKIGWHFTEVRTKVGPIVRVPNSKLVDAEVTNRTTGSVREVEIEFPVRFPAGGFSNCKDTLKGLKDVIQELPLCGRRLVESPEVLFGGMMRQMPGDIPRVKVSVLVDNEGLTGTDRIKSELNIAAMKYMKSKGAQIPGLEF